MLRFMHEITSNMNECFEFFPWKNMSPTVIPICSYLFQTKYLYRSICYSTAHHTMSNTSQLEEETILIDVEAEAEKLNEVKELFDTKHIFIPDRYYAQMAKTGLLDRFVNLIKEESIHIKHAKALLEKHTLFIPPDYYPRLLETDLFEALLQVVHKVDHESEIERIRFIKQTYYLARKYPSNKSTDNENDKTENDIDDRPRKKQKTSPFIE